MKGSIRDFTDHIHIDIEDCLTFSLSVYYILSLLADSIVNINNNMYNL